eukprot:TRINITY_DN6403_c0_g1_i2.p1 TRINITY_DN6403_c0_g1~~TRINITY_DN6403_c0_g1_i2.p1  ORF type:complete len:269 (-),score=100.61 TRINITY_DN6403_c0_g1_i2:187-993(-)
MSTPQVTIRDVWAHNFEREMNIVRGVVEKFPYIAMDTEFPGVVARPIGTFKTTSDYHYQTLRCNVDLLKVIQVGLTFSDGNGNVAPGTCTWQFNLKFSIKDDMYAQDSIELLRQSGLDFKRHMDEGIEVDVFGEMLTTSGVVLNEDVRWLSFHSGYDFGYLLKVLSCDSMPADEETFFDLIHTYFPNIYDIKFLMKSCKNLKGGLNELANNLNVQRIGPQHQAGSDSLLTCAVFFKLRQLYFDGVIDERKYVGVLYGLGVPYQQSGDR